MLGMRGGDRGCDCIPGNCQRLSRAVMRDCIHHPNQCRFRQNGEAQSNESHRRAEWGMDSRRRSRGTTGIYRLSEGASWAIETVVTYSAAINSRDFLSVHSYILSAAVWPPITVAPYLVLVVRVQIQAALLGAFPMCGYALIDVRLVNDLGDQLRAIIDGAGVWRRQLAAEDGIFAAGGDQEAK